MSVENKIKELLSRVSDEQSLTEATAGDATPPMQGSSEKASFEVAPGLAGAGTMASTKMSKDASKAAAAATSGDASMPKQGSSEEASADSADEDEDNLGAKMATKVSKDTSLKPTMGSEDQPMQGDSKKADYTKVESEEVEGKVISEDESSIQDQLNTIFGEDLSEEFKTKATSIFEAAVIARVNNEMEKVTAKLEEQNTQQIAEFKDSLVEKVDNYLSYVVEQWMQENQLAVEAGLRTEITEDFISGLKTLFKEHYIEVPDEKYDVLEEMQKKAEELEAKLNEAIDSNIETSKELVALKKEKIFEEQTKNLADTEVEKLKKLVEGVDFDGEELYREKVAVIKENYFPKAAKTSPEQVLVEESGTNPESFTSNDVMSTYVQALSRTVKSR